MREKSIAGLGVALLLLAILAAYANHFHNSFHFDDGHTITNNTSIRELRNIPLFFRDATTFSMLPSNQSYRPLVSTLLAIDYQLAHGLHPFWFHVSIFALFLALTLLIALVMYHLLDKSNAASSANRWVALVSAAWWALHPANADTINYIIASSGEVISALGVIASFAVYFAFPQFRRYYLYVLPAAIAILAKPTAAIFAVLFAVFRFLFPDPQSRGRPRARVYLAEVIPPFVICGALLLFVQHMTPPSWTPGLINAHDYTVTQPYVALLYFKTFFWPTALSADYDLKPFVTTADPRFWIGCRFAVVFSAVAIVAAASKKTRMIGFGLLWFLIALLPTSLFPLAEVMNDYRAFLSYIGLVIAIAGAARLLVPRMDRQPSWAKIAGTCAVALFLCANADATFQRNKAWKTDETLWHDVLLKSPRNERGLMAYGVQLMAKSDFTGALDYFHRAQELAPQYPELLMYLAIAESATNQSAAAEQHFKDVLRLAPSSLGSYDFYAGYLLQHSRVDEARALLHSALELSPNDLTARQLLKEADIMAGELGFFTLAGTAPLKEAEMTTGDSGLFVLAHAALLKQANTKAHDFGLLVRARPGIGQPLNQPALQTPEFYLALSAQFLSEERYVESIFASRRALELRPGYAEAWNNIGAAYNKLGRYEEAAAACEQALLYKPGLELARINLRYARAKLKTSGR